LYNLANTLRGTGEHREAIERYTQALGLYQQLPHATEDHAKCLYNLANTLRGTGEHREAIERYTQALGLYQQLPHATEDHAKCLYNLANTLRGTGEHREAIERYTQALGLFEQLPHATENHAKCLTGLANTLDGIGESEKAIERYTQALGLFEQLPHATENHADCLTGLASTLSDLGRHKDAYGYYIQALGLYQQLPDPTDDEQAHVEEELGVILSHLSEFEEAEPHLRRALKLLEKLPANTTISRRARCLRRLARALIGQSRDSEAETLLRIARSLHTSDPDASTEDHIYCLMSLSSLLLQRDSFEEAQSIIEEARVVADRAGLLTLFHEVSAQFATDLASKAFLMPPDTARDQTLTTALELILPTALFTDASRFQFDTEAQRSRWFHHTAEPRMDLTLRLAYELQRFDLISELTARWRMVGTLSIRAYEHHPNENKDPHTTITTTPTSPPPAPTTRKPGPQLLMPYGTRNTLSQTDPSPSQLYAHYK
ncbi:tetratricopeptide repeat protein, partial [Schaalia cardiffensis]|uniref:tetratricopeptide repeat protein n=1 Tax=Schaalia cardiffensis TaxID=181487 RepID=UPI0023F45FB7